MDHKEQQDNKANKAFLDHRVSPVHQDLLVHLEVAVVLVTLDFPVRRATLEV